MTIFHGEDPTPPDIRADQVTEGADLPAPGGPATYREVETKLRVPVDYRLPDMTAAVGVDRVDPQEVRELRAVYHDTDNLALFRWRVTLRRREGGHDAGWHMKLPVEGADGSVRDELHMPLIAGEVGDVPAELRDTVTAFVRGAELKPVATLATRRAPYYLYDAAGVAFAEVVDDDVQVTNGTDVTDQFREIEVEALTDGADLSAVVELLDADGAEPSHSSKAAGALGPQAQEPPDVPEPGDVNPDAPAADAIKALFQAQVRALLTQDVRVRRDLDDSVHQMRVAARKLRTCLKAFAPLVDRKWSKGLRAELAWIAGELGDVRDTEVLLERWDEYLGEQGDNDAALARRAIDPVLRKRLDRARTEVLSALATDRHVELLDRLVTAARQPRVSELAARPCCEVLPSLVDKSWRGLERKVERLDLAGPSDTWHRARIAAKRARYAAGATERVFGEPASTLEDTLSQVTDVLGEHQDARVAQDVIREIAAATDVDGSAHGFDGATRFALGRLLQHEVELEQRKRHEFQELWPMVTQTYRETDLTGADPMGTSRPGADAGGATDAAAAEADAPATHGAATHDDAGPGR